MEELSIHELATLFNIYCSVDGSIYDTQRLFCEKFNKTTAPSSDVIIDLITRYNEDGTIFARRRPLNQYDRSESPVITDSDDIHQLKLQFNDLNNFPYKIKIHCNVTPAERSERLQFAINIQNIASKNENFIDKLIMSNEMNFDLNGNVDTLFYRIGGSKIENFFKVTDHDMKYITVWCGITSTKIIGPYFYENKFAEATSVTSDRYNILIKEVLEDSLDFKTDWWFQQDNNSAHLSVLNLNRLRKLFPNRLICRNGDVNWPPCSPDLIATDFFLWGYLKEKVYINKPKTLYELKMNIVNEIDNIESDLLTAVMQSVLYRARLCEINEGGYTKDIYLPLR